MTIADAFKKVSAFLTAAEHAAQHRAKAFEVTVIAEGRKVFDPRIIETVVHQAEKDIEMALPQIVADAIARIQAALAAHNDQGAVDAKTIAGLQNQVAELNKQLADCKDLDAQKDAQVADLTKQLADTTAQLNEVEAAIAALAQTPAPPPVPVTDPSAPPADGSTATDVTP